ncbi:MAG: ComF family protein, partial [Myxococcales bacterium]|nr:ComF family protein [Myxococcales bacterium]
MLPDLLRGLIDLLAPPLCAGCEEPLDYGESGFCDVCATCIEPMHGPAAFEYGGPLADAIRRYKYERRTDLLAAFEPLLAGAARRHVGRVRLVVPMPCHPRRLRERGFDHVALLAEPVAAALGVPCLRGVLTRARDTPPQASLPQAGRADNVRGAFQCVPVAGTVLLFDDVRTTGATMAAASEA